MEKVLDLKMPGVQELGREELRDVDGGWTSEPFIGVDDWGRAYIWWIEDGAILGHYLDYNVA